MKQWLAIGIAIGGMETGVGGEATVTNVRGFTMQDRDGKSSASRPAGARVSERPSSRR